MFKLVTTVPEKDADRIREVLAEVGAGKLGNYTYCSLRGLEDLKEMRTQILKSAVN